MPIYEYRCEHCGDFEQGQRITDPALDRCPKCRRKVRRLISSTSFQLRGGGWYVTDYARGASNGGGKKEAGTESTTSGSESTAEGKAEGKAESKAEGKAESKPPPTSEKPSS